MTGINLLNVYHNDIPLRWFQFRNGWLLCSWRLQGWCVGLFASILPFLSHPKVHSNDIRPEFVVVSLLAGLVCGIFCVAWRCHQSREEASECMKVRRQNKRNTCVTMHGDCMFTCLLRPHSRSAVEHCFCCVALLIRLNMLTII
jgi:hypothetical protein